jgi:hypothetical protein
MRAVLPDGAITQYTIFFPDRIKYLQSSIMKGNEKPQKVNQHELQSVCKGSQLQHYLNPLGFLLVILLLELFLTIERFSYEKHLVFFRKSNFLTIDCTLPNCFW